MSQAENIEAPADQQTESNDAEVSNENALENTDSSNDAPADKSPAEDSTPPVQEPPEWFMKDKFSSIDEQAKSYPELLKKMGKNWGAPDDYAIEGIDGLVKDDPLLAHIKPAIKELGLSQDGFNHLVKSWQEAHVKLGKEAEEQLKKELTQKEAQTVQTVSKWMDESFSKEDADTMRSWILNVKDFQLLNRLRTMLPAGSNVPSSMANGGVKFETTKEVNNEKIKYRTEVNSGFRVQDKNYENELQQRWRDAFEREQYNKGRK